MSNFKGIEKSKTFFNGITILVSGINYAFKNKTVLVLAFIPVVVTVISLFLGFESLFKVFFEYSSNILIKGALFDFWGGFILLWISEFLLKILVGFLTIFVFYICLQIIYIPICSLLAEKVLLSKGMLRHKSVLKSLIFNIRMMGVGLLKSVILIGLGFLCLISSFVPFLNFLPIYFALVVLSYDSFDYGLELYGLSFRERLLFIRKEFMTINGHAGVLFLFSFIPGLILLTVPFSVIGASLLIGESNEFKRTAAS